MYRNEIIKMAKRLAYETPAGFEAQLERRMTDGLAEARRRGLEIPGNFPDLMAASAARLATQEGTDPERAAIFARNLAEALTTTEPEAALESEDLCARFDPPLH